MAAKTIAVFGPDSRYLSHCTWKRATSLLNSGRAIKVDIGTIKLKYTRQEWIKVKHSVIDDAKRVCYICGCSIPEDETATVDHVIPSSRNSEADTDTNLRCCCERCNHDKANKKLSEYVRHIYAHRDEYDYISDKKLKYLENFAFYHEKEFYDNSRNVHTRGKCAYKRKYGRKKRK